MFLRIEQLLKFRCLDFEFAIKGQDFYILQVRKLKNCKNVDEDKLIFEEIKNSSTFLGKYLKKKKYYF